jgi:lysine-specific permease
MVGIDTDNLHRYNLLISLGVNLIGVKGFGDAEYVFSIIKIIAILLFIIIGTIYIIVSGTWLTNWGVEGAPFVHGLYGL